MIIKPKTVHVDVGERLTSNQYGLFRTNRGLWEMLVGDSWWRMSDKEVEMYLGRKPNSRTGGNMTDKPQTVYVEMGGQMISNDQRSMAEGKTRSEHLQWCKSRAIALLKDGDIAGGMASFTSDMTKHPETNETMQNGLSHPIIMQALMTNDPRRCIAAVEGFN